MFKTLHLSLMKWTNLDKIKQQHTFWNDSGMHLSRNLLQCSSFSVRSLVEKKNILKYHCVGKYKTNEAIVTWKYWGQATSSNRVEVCIQMPIRFILMKVIQARYICKKKNAYKCFFFLNVPFFIQCNYFFNIKHGPFLRSKKGVRKIICNLACSKTSVDLS